MLANLILYKDFNNVIVAVYVSITWQYIILSCYSIKYNNDNT